MKQIGAVRLSGPFYELLVNLCAVSHENTLSPEKICNDLEILHFEFCKRAKTLLSQRDSLQEELNRFFDHMTDNGKTEVAVGDVVSKLESLAYIQSSDSVKAVLTSEIAAEISPMAGPQLVVPADKVNMVLNASNARWGSLYKALYASNLVEGRERSEREKNVINYSCELLNRIFPLSKGQWEARSQIVCNNGQLTIINAGTNSVLCNSEAFIALDLVGDRLGAIVLKNNGLRVELVVDEDGFVTDVQFESALSYIIDLEDASVSTPESKLEAYRIVHGIVSRDLSCEVRGKMRVMQPNRVLVSPEGGEVVLDGTSVALVRDVGMHLMADPELISIDGDLFSEKVLDCYMTSLCGMRYHVAPKMHGVEEVSYTVELFERINQLQGLSQHANKIGIMNEEMRTTAQLGVCIDAARNVIFFTNTGFLDYTGSFIDLMMHQGPIAPYRELSGKTYKTSYEVFNVNESLLRGVPQIGAGMWAKIRDMKGLLVSKKEQVEGCTDTGWSPSPTAATLHVLAFHLYGDVRQLQDVYLNNLPKVTHAQLFEFPRADIESLSNAEIIENLDFAIHGLLAYAEPWVRRGIGCSGVMELSGDPLMEDRATARIKAAFVRNWLLHAVIDKADVEDSVVRMVALVNEQNSETDGYDVLVVDNDPVVEAVKNLVYNPKQFYDSYVEFYFYEANRKANRGA